MKLIVENSQHGVYAYVETEKQFKNAERYRKNEQGLIRYAASELEEECNLENFPNGYFVFDIKKR